MQLYLISGPTLGPTLSLALLDDDESLYSTPLTLVLATYIHIPWDDVFGGCIAWVVVVERFGGFALCCVYLMRVFAWIVSAKLARV